MHELLITLSIALGCLISGMTIARFTFYTKDEVDKKLNDAKELSDKKDETIQSKIEQQQSDLKEDLAETRENIFEKLLEAERNNNRIVNEIYDRLNQNKQIFDDYNKNMLEAISQMKSEEKEITTNMVQIVNAVKDELKNDYINRYNDLLKIIGTKANLEDFNRLEAKFDKITESITELKTIVQMQRENKNK